MDPLNNPTPTPNPNPSPMPQPNPVPPAPEPSPMSEPTPVSTPVPSIQENPRPVVPSPVTTPPPVNPVINPSGTPPVNPVFKPETVGIAATDPIMTPEPAPEPDPVEEELKAPMKAAEPVPGSIGSAVSGPMGEQPEPAIQATENPFDNTPKERVQSVAFNDPAVQPNAASGNGATQPAKKPQNKKTLIILIAIAAVVVVILAIILIMQLVGGNNNGVSSANNSSSSNTVNNNNASNSDSGSGNNSDDVVTLSCTRNMRTDEVVLINDAVSGTVNVSAEFELEKLSYISLVKSVVYADENDSKNEPVETEVHESTAEDLVAGGSAIYYLPLNENNKIVSDLDSIQENYESLDFTCELL